MPFTASTVSVVIGGTSGIGRAVADALSQRPGTVHRLSRTGNQSGTGALDIRDPAAVAAAFAALGPVDHVVVTAGSQAPNGPLVGLDLTPGPAAGLDLTPGPAAAMVGARAAFDTKFWGSLTVAQAAARHLRPGGSLTLTSGFLARRATPGTVIKTAMNAAIEASAKVLARELAPLRVNVISPGLTDTESYAALPAEARQAMLDRARATLPAGRAGTPADLAAAYLFVIDNAFVTGAVLDVDGGALIA